MSTWETGYISGKVTGAPIDYDAWRGTGRGVVRHVNGDTQFVTLPGGYPSQVYQMAGNPFFMNYAMNVDPMGVSWGGAYTQPTSNGNGSQIGQQMAAMAGARDFDKAWTANIMTQQLPQAISSLETGLENALKSDTLNSSQKAKLQKHLDEIKALKGRIERAQANITREQAEAFKKELNAIQERLAKTQEEINKELAGKSSSGTPGSSSDSSSDSSDDSSSVSEDDPIKVGDIEVDPKTGKPTSLSNTDKNIVRDVTDKLFDAIDGPGTKNEVIEELIPGLEASNVIEIMQAFDDFYNQSNDKGETLAVRLMNDLSHGEKKKYAPMIKNALIARAEALGIADDPKFKGYIGTLNSELDDWDIDEDVVGEALDNMRHMITEKENSNKVEAQKIINNNKTKAKDKENKAKADEKAKNQKEVETKKGEFLRDMKIALKLDETPELSDKVTVETNEDGSFKCFKVTIEGVNYEAYTYAQMAENIKEYGYKPEEYLIKKKLDKTA